MLPKLCLCPWVLKRNAETELWVKLEWGGLLLLWQGKDATAG